MTGIESEARRQGPSVRAWEHPPVIVAAVAQSRGNVVGLPERELRAAGADAKFCQVVQQVQFPLSTASFLHPDERKDHSRDREDSSNDHQDDSDDFVNPYLPLLVSNVFEEERMPV
jgi:hypothetical protein